MWANQQRLLPTPYVSNSLKISIICILMACSFKEFAGGREWTENHFIHTSVAALPPSSTTRLTATANLRRPTNEYVSPSFRRSSTIQRGFREADETPKVESSSFWSELHRNLRNFDLRVCCEFGKLADEALCLLEDCKLFVSQLHVEVACVNNGCHVIGSEVITKVRILR